jgi:hypothetical protein
MHTHWMFLFNVLAHLVASMSGLASFAFSFWEHARQKKLESRVFFIVGFLCLIVAFDQAWQDEHRNSQILIAEKASAVSEKDFWKDQSYQKDHDLRSRDDVIAKSSAALIGEQSTENQTQTVLAQLANKIIDINKPEHLHVAVHQMVINAVQSPVLAVIVAETNKRVVGAKGTLTCLTPYVASQIEMITGMMNFSPSYTLSGLTTKFDFGGNAWSPNDPVLFVVVGTPNTAQFDPSRCDVHFE